MLRLFFSALSFLFLSVAAFSQPYDHIITGDYVRKHFALAKGEEVKFEEFKKKTYPTATVVWGVPEKGDALRLKAGVAPSGSKLLVVFAEVGAEKDFERVRATYKDGSPVTGIGRKAVMSEKWKQLSVLLNSKLIVHIHLDHPGTTDLKTKLIAIARDIQAAIK